MKATILAADVVPGLIMTGLFMAVVAAAAHLKPSLAEHETRRTSRTERLRRLRFLLPPVGIL